MRPKLQKQSALKLVGRIIPQSLLCGIIFIGIEYFFAR